MAWTSDDRATTSKFIPADLQHPNGPDLIPVDNQIWGRDAGSNVSDAS